MKVLKYNNLDIKVPKGNAFAHETPPLLPKCHGNFIVNAKRGSGKTVATSNLVKMMNYDKIIMVSPSIKSNRPILNMLKIDDDDIFEDVDDISVLDKIVKKIEFEKDDLQRYYEELEEYKHLMKTIQTGNPLTDIPKEQLTKFYDGVNFQPPEPTKYNNKVPKIAVVFDDCLGSQIYTKGIRKLNKMAIYHRHIGQFDKPVHGHTSVGCSLFFLVQSYRCSTGGLSKAIRNNCTCMLLWKSKNEKELAEIQEEMSGELAKDKFMKLYNYVFESEDTTPHDFMMIDLHKKDNHPSQFRKNFNQFLVLDKL